MASYLDKTEYADTLGMGDVYKRSEYGKPIGPLSWVDFTVDGGCWTRVQGRLIDVFAECARVYVVSRAPKCPCGTRYEDCENECEWPQWAEDAFMGRPVTMPPSRDR